MSQWLLDTCVLSELVKKAPDPAVLEWMKLHGEQSFICAVSIGEIQYGIERLALGARRNRLQIWLDELQVNFQPRTLGTTQAVWLLWGRLKHEADALGRSREDLDLLIAATARVYQVGLATRNIKHFSDTGLMLTNPWEPDL